MSQTGKSVAMITLVVRDYDDAIAFYTHKLGFTLLEDTILSPTKRWVRVGLSSGCELLLAKAKDITQESYIGNQTGGRVFLFVHTETFDADFYRFKSEQVKVVRPPSQESFGKVMVIADLYGNLIDWIQRSKTN